jgi:hypothetical protein
MRRLDLLQAIDIFEHLTIKNIYWLLETLKEEFYLPKDIIVEEDSIGHKFYIIESGIAKCYSNKKENK